MDTAARIACNEKGMVMIYMAVLMMMLMALLGLAVDSGHLFKVRGELQNAADAAALKGAWHLYTRPNNPSQHPTLQWNVALQKAKEMMTENSSDNVALKDALVEVGYWNLDTNTLQPTTMPSPTVRDVPAVRVTASRSADNNGGPVSNFFMQLFGKEQTPVASKPAVALLGYPGTIPEGGLFPMALSKCMTDQYFKQDPMPDPPPQIAISSPYLPGGDDCWSGQWTSFDTGNNDVTTIKEFMYGGNTTPLETGDSIWIEPGAMSSLFSPILTNWLPEGGKDVLMAIVDGDLNTKGAQTITGFATFHIDSAIGGGTRQVYGHFIEYFASPPGTRPGGTPSNTLSNPLLVQ